MRMRMSMRMGDFVDFRLFEGNGRNLNGLSIWGTRRSSKEENGKKIYDECGFKL
jgi:hypothetical protein